MGDPIEIGPKAESLRRLTAAGLPVPEARFLGTDAYRAHARRAGLPALLAEAGDGPLDAASARDAILALPLDEELAERLRVWHRVLGGGRVAVRSSGSAEDLPGASFAGQHGTYFVDSAEGVVDRVRDCWASLFSERAVRYRERAGVDHREVAMAVVVQTLVPATAAGVTFTYDPMLSHGSIIAREYGIPAVVNVGPATRLIHTGQLIEVDGDKGEVRILG